MKNRFTITPRASYREFRFERRNRLKIRIFGHRHGDLDVGDVLRKEIENAIANRKVTIARGKASELRDDILRSLTNAGWSPEVEIDPTSKISITSIKKRVGLCLQTGNMGRMYADMLKLQTLYLRESITTGVFILPGANAAKKLGDNLANFDRLVRELPIFERTITLPILIAAID
jgi:hypothetical protein